MHCTVQPGRYCMAFPSEAADPVSGNPQGSRNVEDGGNSALSNLWCQEKTLQGIVVTLRALSQAAERLVSSDLCGPDEISFRDRHFRSRFGMNVKKSLKLRWLSSLAVVFLSATIFVSAAGAQTLRDALAGKQVVLEGASLPNLDNKITSGAELDDANQFVIAYYLDDGSGQLNPPLFVERFDRKSKTWQSGALGKVGTAEAPSLCFGSVLDISSLPDQLILETHISPSAGCALIVSRELKLEATLDGWVLGHFEDGTIAYHRSQVHFATVHPSRIAVYSEHNRKDFTIFPPQTESPVRARLTAALRDFFQTHQDYCVKANDPCDPAEFDSALAGKIALDEREHAIAFVISYELQGYGQDQSKPSGPSQVTYVYRNVNDEAKVEYRELLPEDLKAQFGDISLQELLEPDRLDVLFQKRTSAKAARTKLSSPRAAVPTAQRRLHPPASP